MAAAARLTRNKTGARHLSSLMNASNEDTPRRPTWTAQPVGNPSHSPAPRGPQPERPPPWHPRSGSSGIRVTEWECVAIATATAATIWHRIDTANWPSTDVTATAAAGPGERSEWIWTTPLPLPFTSWFRLVRNNCSENHCHMTVWHSPASQAVSVPHLPAIQAALRHEYQRDPPVLVPQPRSTPASLAPTTRIPLHSLNSAVDCQKVQQRQCLHSAPSIWLRHDLNI
jgi:hypothetical protein